MTALALDTHQQPLGKAYAGDQEGHGVVGAFPDGQSALMLVAARLRHVSGTRWGTRQYLNMGRLTENAVEMA